MLRLIAFVTAAVLLASAARAEDIPTRTDIPAKTDLPDKAHLPLPPPLNLGTQRSKPAPRTQNTAAVRIALAAHIQRFKKYPADAGGDTGTVLVKIRLAADGTLLESAIVTPTCSDVLNKAALAIVRRAAPFPPSDFYGSEYRVPLVFLTSRTSRPMPAGCHPAPTDNATKGALDR